MPKAKPVVKEGKVVSIRDKFYVQVGRSRLAIPTGAFVDERSLRRLAGQTVPVTLVGKSIASIGKRPFILCYVPADPFIFDLVQPELQRVLQKKYAEAGIITAG